MKDSSKLVVSIFFCEFVGILGVPFTQTGANTWYQTLTRPSFAPPNWLFAPAWTLLYLLMGIAFYLIWRQGWKKREIRKASNFFYLQLALNLFWSPLFFGLKSPLLGLIDIILLWILIAITMRKFYPFSKLASYLLIPYILWVSFATVLNAAILFLN